MASNSSQLTRWGVLLLRLAAGGLFLWAGAVKAGHPEQFLADLRSYRLLPYPGAVAVALYLPWLEILCGLGLITRRLYRGSLLLLLVLLTLAFLAAMGSAWHRGIEISCGCFGSGGEADYPELLVRDLGVLLMLGILLLQELKAGAASRSLQESVAAK